MGPASPFRILYMIDEMEAVTSGGTERQLMQMIRLLVDAGVEVRLCTLRGTHWLTDEIAGCPVEHFAFLSLLRPGSQAELLRLRAYMRDYRPHVLQTFFVEANILGPIVGRLAGVPVIVGGRRNLNYWMGPLTSSLQRFANRYTTRLLANSEAVKEHVVRTEHIHPAQVDVIYNGLDVERFRPDPESRAAMRQKFGFTDDQILIGAVSVLRPIKGCEDFIDAAALVLRQQPSTRFVLVGDGPIRSELELRAKALGDCFTFAGAQPDVRPFLQMFDIGVLSSESEGFSNSILEYLAAGLPCVVTDVGGNREAVGNAGVSIPVRDPNALAKALVGLVSDPALRQSLASAALARAPQFSLAAAQRNLVSYYQKLGAGTGPLGGSSNVT